MNRLFALLLAFMLLIASCASAENVVVWGAEPTTEESPVVVWGDAPAAEEEAPAVEEEAPGTETEGVQTYSWDEFQNYAQLMGAEGHFYNYDQFSLQMFVPGALSQTEVSEENAAQGILDIFQGEEHSLQIVTQYSFIGEGLETVDDLLNALDEETFDFANTTKINPYNALLVSRDDGQTLVVAISADGGYFFQVTYHNMGEEQWNTDMTALSMASIQPMDEPEA